MGYGFSAKLLKKKSRSRRWESVDRICLLWKSTWPKHDGSIDVNEGREKELFVCVIIRNNTWSGCTPDFRDRATAASRRRTSASLPTWARCPAPTFTWTDGPASCRRFRSWKWSGFRSGSRSPRWGRSGATATRGGTGRASASALGCRRRRAAPSSSNYGKTLGYVNCVPGRVISSEISFHIPFRRPTSRRTVIEDKKGKGKRKGKEKSKKAINWLIP